MFAKLLPRSGQIIAALRKGAVQLFISAIKSRLSVAIESGVLRKGVALGVLPIANCGITPGQQWAAISQLVIVLWRRLRRSGRSLFGDITANWDGRWRLDGLAIELFDISQSVVFTKQLN